MVSLIAAEGGKSHVAVQQEPDIPVIVGTLPWHTLMADCMWLYVSDGKFPDSKHGKVKQNTMVSLIVPESGKSPVSVQQKPDNLGYCGIRRRLNIFEHVQGKRWPLQQHTEGRSLFHSAGHHQNLGDNYVAY